MPGKILLVRGHNVKAFEYFFNVFFCYNHIVVDPQVFFEDFAIVPFQLQIFSGPPTASCCFAVTSASDHLQVPNPLTSKYY